MDIKLKDEEILNRLKHYERDAQSFYEENEGKYQHWLDVYDAKPEYYKTKFPELSKKSNLTMQEAKNIISWIMPGLLSVFFTSKEVVKFSAENNEDVPLARIAKPIVNYNLQKKNNFFMECYHWFNDACKLNFGVKKCYWKREFKNIVVDETLSAEEANALNPADVISITPNEKSYNIALDEYGFYDVRRKVNKKVKDHLCIEHVPISELRWNSSAKSLNEAIYVAHLSVKTLDEIRLAIKNGIYNHIKNIDDDDTENLKKVEYTALELRLNPSLDNEKNFDEVEEGLRKFIVTETYTKMDINKDGFLEDVIIKSSGDVILDIRENEYKRHTFFSLSPFPDPFNVVGSGIIELVEEIQDISIAFIRQVSINVAESNDPKILFDPRYINFNDLKKGSKYIPTKFSNNIDMRSVIMPMPPQQISNLTLPFIELMNKRREETMGVNRFNTGVATGTETRTATGIAMLTEASNQRVGLIAKLFAETGFLELMRFATRLCLQYSDPEFVLRLTNEQLPDIDPEELELDITINTGIGIMSSETRVRNLQMIMGLYPMLMQLGCATNENFYNAAKNILEEMGEKDIDGLLTNPLKTQQLVQEQMLMQQLMQQNAGGETYGNFNSGLPEGANNQRENVGGVNPIFSGQIQQ